MAAALERCSVMRRTEEDQSAQRAQPLVTSRTAVVDRAPRDEPTHAVTDDGNLLHGLRPMAQQRLQQVGELTLPLPPLATQRAIVAEIEAEQALVAANRELITRFEQKIQATLARIWGENGEHG
jgi:hypothetical protein